MAILWCTLVSLLLAANREQLSLPAAPESLEVPAKARKPARLLFLTRGNTAQRADFSAPLPAVAWLPTRPLLAQHYCLAQLCRELYVVELVDVELHANHASPTVAMSAQKGVVSLLGLLKAIHCVAQPRRS